MKPEHFNKACDILFGHSEDCNCYSIHLIATQDGIWLSRLYRGISLLELSARGETPEKALVGVLALLGTNLEQKLVETQETIAVLLVLIESLLAGYFVFMVAMHIGVHFVLGFFFAILCWIRVFMLELREILKGDN